MTKLNMSQNDDGFWTVSTRGLVVTGLTREAAQAFVEAYQRCEG